MKICIISTTIFTVPTAGYSGLEHLAWQHAKGLAERKHEVTLVAPKGSSCPNVTIHETKQGQTEYAAYNAYKHTLKDFDVVIDHSWSKWTVIGRQEEICPPSLLVCHAPINTMYQARPHLDKPCFVGISRDHTESIKEHLKVDARCAYNGVDLDFYKPTGLKRNDRYLFLARFSSIKGPDLAIDACLKTEKTLDLVGDDKITNEPGYLDQIKQVCQQQKNLKFIGPQTRTQCSMWFNTNKCLLHPIARFREPFGLAVVEAQACGMPVIAWDHGSMREIIANGDTGFLVNSMEEMVELIKNDAAFMIQGHRCMQWAAQFSYEKMITRYEELCTEAIESGW